MIFRRDDSQFFPHRPSYTPKARRIPRLWREEGVDLLHFPSNTADIVRHGLVNYFSSPSHDFRERQHL
jgi:hypothetical protein